MNRRSFLASCLLTLAGTIPQLRPSRLIICDGNSITAAAAAYYTRGNWQPWPYQLAGLTGERVLNVAVGATNIEHCSQRAGLNVDRMVGLANETWLVIWEGTNHLSVTMDAQLSFDAQQAYCNARRAAGVGRIFVGTIISRDPETCTYTEAMRLEFNRLVRTCEWSVIDFGEMAEMGPVDAWRDTRYFYDGIHPTDAGSRLLAEAAQAALRYVEYLPLVRG